MKATTSATTTSWVRREVPKDHACLFASLVMLVDGVETYRSSTDRFSAVLELRKHCADTVVGDAETWPEWKLGRAPAEYAAWITKPDTWGGEIELLILSAKLGVEVSVVDMATQNIITYNEHAPPASKQGRVHLLYTGQHYDPIVQVDTDGNDVLIVPLAVAGAAGSAEAGAAQLKQLAGNAYAEAERKKRQRVVKKIKCTDCGALLDNASAFQEHCMDEDIEHSDDFAYECDEVCHFLVGCWLL